jgi:ABC-type lipoprotein export system ATPase subunit
MSAPDPRLSSQTQSLPNALEPGCELIQLQDVTKIFKSAAGEFTALKDINLCFGEGEFVSIMGKSGSGKSTLINMISGIDHPTRGTVRVGNTDIHHLSEGQLAVWRGQTIGIVFQFFQLLPMLTVLENTMLPMDFSNLIPPDEREDRARYLLELVGLQDETDKLPAALSGGQQQTAAIARALANDPPLIVADEPTGNLDSRTAEKVLDIFNDLAGKGKTILIVTHDPGLTQCTNRRVYIADGCLINEMVTQALPELPHIQLLKLSRQALPCAFEAGAMIAPAKTADLGLHIITRGVVEVHRSNAQGGSAVVNTLTAGGYFSELDILEDSAGKLSFSVSSSGPVETLCLNQPAFCQMLSESSSAAQILRRQASTRRVLFIPPAASIGGS